LLSPTLPGYTQFCSQNPLNSAPKIHSTLFPKSNFLTVTTDDIEATVKSVKAAGGKAETPVVQLPFGTFAVLADPTGAVFAVFEIGQR
jgi:predicted enzyme related to lactoylglutathione lyase